MIFRRSPAWSYLGAFYLVLAGWLVAVKIAAGDWDAAKTADITPVSERTDKSATAGRIAVYTDTPQPEHTSELQSRGHLVCRLLLEKKKKNKQNIVSIS